MPDLKDLERAVEEARSEAMDVVSENEDKLHGDMLAEAASLSTCLDALVAAVVTLERARHPMQMTAKPTLQMTADAVLPEVVDDA